MGGYIAVEDFVKFGIRLGSDDQTDGLGKQISPDPKTR